MQNMKTMRGFFWSEDTSLKRRRLLLGATLFLVCILWFVLGALSTVASNEFLWGLFWIVGGIITLVFILLLKTRRDCDK